MTAAGRSAVRPSGRPAATRPARAGRASRTGPTGRTGRRAASGRGCSGPRPSSGLRRVRGRPTGSSTRPLCTARRRHSGVPTCRAPRPPLGPTRPAPSRRPPPPGGVGRGSRRRGAWLAGSRSGAPGWGRSDSVGLLARRTGRAGDSASRPRAADHVGGTPGRRQGPAPDSARGLDRSAASGRLPQRDDRRSRHAGDPGRTGPRRAPHAVRRRGGRRPDRWPVARAVREPPGRGGRARLRGTGRAARADGPPRLPRPAPRRARGRGRVPGDVPRPGPLGPVDPPSRLGRGLAPRRRPAGRVAGPARGLEAPGGRAPGRGRPPWPRGRPELRRLGRRDPRGDRPPARARIARRSCSATCRA